MRQCTYGSNGLFCGSKWNGFFLNASQSTLGPNTPTIVLFSLKLNALKDAKESFCKQLPDTGSI